MKNFAFTCLIWFLFSHHARSQTLGEWFEQKKTQIDYLVDQIAAYNIYMQDLEKGYGIARSGLQTISAFKAGEWDLHRWYFTLLGEANPAFSQIADFLKIQEQDQLFTSAKNALQTLPEILPAERSWITGVLSAVIENRSRNLDALNRLLTTHDYSISDGQRLEQIQKRVGELTSLSSSVLAFADTWKGISAQRKIARSSLQYLKKYLTQP